LPSTGTRAVKSPSRTARRVASSFSASRPALPGCARAMRVSLTEVRPGAEGLARSPRASEHDITLAPGPPQARRRWRLRSGSLRIARVRTGAEQARCRTADRFQRNPMREVELSTLLDQALKEGHTALDLSGRGLT